MAVLTAITNGDARALLGAYDLGDLGALEGLAAGSVNSNFSLEAGGRRLFLRLYEEQNQAGAERETAMLRRLAAAGVPTPAPLPRTDGAFVSVLRGKPAALFPWREGTMRCQASVTENDAAQVGAALARVHVAAAANDHGGKVAPDSGRFRFEDLLVRLDAIAASKNPPFVALAPTLRAALERIHSARNTGLPRGVVHGDLFRDNVLWTADGQLAALLDFESACDGTYAFDLMVTVLAWCVGDDLDPALASAMVRGYEQVRPLVAAERSALSVEGSFAALRFTITRITDYAMRVDLAGPRVVKDWRRFMMRFDKLQAMGSEGVRRVLGT